MRFAVSGWRRWPVVLVLLGALALGGCNGAFWGNVIVLGVSVGIFFGTLALGRAAGSATRSGSASSSSSSSR